MLKNKTRRVRSLPTWSRYLCASALALTLPLDLSVGALFENQSQTAGCRRIKNSSWQKEEQKIQIKTKRKALRFALRSKRHSPAHTHTITHIQIPNRRQTHVAELLSAGRSVCLCVLVEGGGGDSHLWLFFIQYFACIYFMCIRLWSRYSRVLPLSSSPLSILRFIELATRLMSRSICLRFSLSLFACLFHWYQFPF